MTTDRNRRSYRAGGRIAREQMRRQAPDDEAALRAVTGSDVVVVRGQYDRVESVLDVLDLPHTVVGPDRVGDLRLRPHQLLVVNCPGHIGRRGVETVRRFVRAGGSLFTTDWALRHVVEPAFPGTIGHNGIHTHDDVVRIAVTDRRNPFLAGVMEEGDDPHWWLESSSYPIRVDHPSVEILIESAELARKYGEAPVAVLFRHGEGEVFHMISHYYLQRTELRTSRHRAPASMYAADRGVADAPDLDDLTVGEVEAATSSARMVANVIADKKRRNTR
jgi:hypothetical protein